MKKIGWGERLRQLRGGHSLLSWSAIVGSNKTSWHKYENEDHAPGLDVLLRIKANADVSLDWIATGEVPSAGINYDVLRQVIQAVQEEVPKIDAESKAKLILRLYKDRILLLQQEHEAASVKKGKAAS